LFFQKLIFLQVKALAEPLHTPSRVQNALLASEERMAFRANVNFQDGLDAQCLEAITTGATDCGFNVVWVNAFFHEYLRRLDPLRSMAKENAALLSVPPSRGG
jgi:hypothetical protein